MKRPVELVVIYFLESTGCGNAAAGTFTEEVELIVHVGAYGKKKALKKSVPSAIAVGMRQATALRFSFMLYIPVSFGTIVLGISDFWGEPNKAELALPYAVTFITAVIVTYMAMKWFMGIMKNGKLHYFAYYCFTMGSFLLIYF